MAAVERQTQADRMRYRHVTNNKIACTRSTITYISYHRTRLIFIPVIIKVGVVVEESYAEVEVL